MHAIVQIEHALHYGKQGMGKTRDCSVCPGPLLATGIRGNIPEKVKSNEKMLHGFHSRNALPRCIEINSGDLRRESGEQNACFVGPRPVRTNRINVPKLCRFSLLGFRWIHADWSRYAFLPVFLNACDNTIARNHKTGCIMATGFCGSTDACGNGCK